MIRRHRMYWCLRLRKLISLDRRMLSTCGDSNMACDYSVDQSKLNVGCASEFHPGTCFDHLANIKGQFPFESQNNGMKK